MDLLILESFGNLRRKAFESEGLAYRRPPAMLEYSQMWSLGPDGGYESFD